jgi:hypothetical protein
LRKRPERPEDQISAGTANTTTVPTTKLMISPVYIVAFLPRLAVCGEMETLIPRAAPPYHLAILNNTISRRTVAVIRKVA